MKYWWVNQNQTYQHEVGGGYLWSPKVNANGSRNRFYDAMTETQVGDVIFSFCDTFIKAIGIVSGPCSSAPKPTEFGAVGANWNDSGWFIQVQFTEISKPIQPKKFMADLAPALPKKYSPLQANGNGNQGVYLAPVPDAMATVLRSLLAGQVEEVIVATVVEDESVADKEQLRIVKDESIATTERDQLVKARIGQGLFRSRVELLDPVCRITGVSDRRFLRASHIKPWAKSTNAEKLDGANGLLLAPHVDHLFDKGFISFDDNGKMLISDRLPSSVISAWSLSQSSPIRPLTTAQVVYMKFHRANVFGC